MNARPFSQAVSWPGTTMGSGTPEEFVAFIAEEFNGTRAQFIGEFTTSPDLDRYGDVVPETGGRIDLVFGVHEEDIGKFAVARLAYGMRWVDDCIDGEKQSDKLGTIYSPEFHALYSWDKREQPTTSETDVD